MVNSVEKLAGDLAAAWAKGTTIRLPDDYRPATRAEAYEIQDRMAELIGDTVIGWKVGSSAHAIQIAEGHDGPIPGRIFASRVYQSPATLPAGRFSRSKAECELAFRLTRSFTPRNDAYNPDEVASGLIFLPAIEIAETRYDLGASGRPRHTYDEIADNGSGAGFVIGREVADWQSIDFAAITVEAGIVGGLATTAHGPDYRRDPLEAAVEMINDIVRRGHAVEQGHYLTTGSLTLPQALHAGQDFKASFNGFETLGVTLL